MPTSITFHEFGKKESLESESLQNKPIEDKFVRRLAFNVNCFYLHDSIVDYLRRCQHKIQFQTYFGTLDDPKEGILRFEGERLHGIWIQEKDFVIFYGAHSSMDSLQIPTGDGNIKVIPRNDGLILHLNNRPCQTDEILIPRQNNISTLVFVDPYYECRGLIDLEIEVAKDCFACFSKRQMEVVELPSSVEDTKRKFTTFCESTISPTIYYVGHGHISTGAWANGCLPGDLLPILTDKMNINLCVCACGWQVWFDDWCKYTNTPVTQFRLFYSHETVRYFYGDELLISLFQLSSTKQACIESLLKIRAVFQLQEEVITKQNFEQLARRTFEEIGIPSVQPDNLPALREQWNAYQRKFPEAAMVLYHCDLDLSADGVPLKIKLLPFLGTTTLRIYNFLKEVASLFPVELHHKSHFVGITGSSVAGFRWKNKKPSRLFDENSDYDFSLISNDIFHICVKKYPNNKKNEVSSKPADSSSAVANDNDKEFSFKCLFDITEKYFPDRPISWKFCQRSMNNDVSPPTFRFLDNEDTPIIAYDLREFHDGRFHEESKIGEFIGKTPQAVLKEFIHSESN